MKKVIVISEECHGTIGVAENFQKAKEYLLESGWVNEFWDYYAPGTDFSVPIVDAFGENWQEKFLEMDKNDFDGSFYFYEMDFMD